MPDQPFFAVRVVVHYDNGGSTERDYVRGQQRMGKDRFAAFALGDLLMLTEAGQTSPVTWSITEIDSASLHQFRNHL